MKVYELDPADLYRGNISLSNGELLKYVADWQGIQLYKKVVLPGKPKDDRYYIVFAKTVTAFVEDWQGKAK